MESRPEKSELENNKKNAIEAGQQEPLYCCHINSQTAPIKLAYFIHNLRTSCYLPFLILIFNSFGLSKTQGGMIAGIRLIGTIMGNLFWGFVIDKTRRYYLIVVIQVVFAMLMMFPQPFLNLYYGISTVNVTLSTDDVHIKESKSPDQSGLFFALLFLNIGATFFDGSLGYILDSVVVRRIETSDYKIDFGRQRMFGTPSFAVGTILSKHVVAIAPKMPISCYAVLYMLYGVFILIEMVCLLHLLHTTNSKPSKDSPETKYGITLLKTCLKPDTVFLFCTMFVNGFLLSAYISYFIPYLKDQKAPNIVFDVLFTINSFSSLCGLAFSTKIIKILKGPWNVFFVSTAAYAFRFIVYSVSNNTWFLLLVEPLHMFSYAVFIAAFVNHIKDTSPKNILNSMYGFANSLLFGYSFIAGNIFGGYYYDQHGARMFYTFEAVVAGCWCAVILLRNIGHRFVVSRS